MKYAYKYHCVQCNYLIAAANKPLDVDPDCLSCRTKHKDQMIERRKQKISVDAEFRANKRKKLIREKLRLKKEKEARNAKN